MKNVEIVYDFSRYSDFLLQPGPSGIGRTDLRFLQFLAENPRHFCAGIHHCFGIKTRISLATVKRLTRLINANWNEFDQQPIGQQLEKWLEFPDAAVRRIREPTGTRVRHLRGIAQLIMGWPWHNPMLRIPEGAFYLNVSYANTEDIRKFAWLEKRADIVPVFLVHDLIPASHPEFFWEGYGEVFQRRLETILHHARVVIVPSLDVRERLIRLASSKGRSDLAIHAIPFPPVQNFLDPIKTPDKAAAYPYFVICGTLEPRKNHLLLLDIWHKMIKAGKTVPRLVIVGNRGWRNQRVFEMLDGSPELEGRVLEVSGLSTADLRKLMTNARAVLMPSLAEGFGLPLIEALSIGTPVIASDIAVFREVTQGCAHLIDPADGAAWQDAILHLTHDDAAFDRARHAAAGFVKRDWQAYFGEVMAALENHATNPARRASGRGG